jgi:N-acetylmuramoyl-L-alanine amidase
MLLYAAKVVLCSGVLFGYYCLALRNRTFHQWNRFYLLASVLFSLTAPLLKISVGSDYTPPPSQVLHLLNVTMVESEAAVANSSHSKLVFAPEQWAWLSYSLVCLTLLFIIVANGIRIYGILRSYPKKRINGIYFLNTDARGTPFSFFHYIVWNQAIDLASENGQRIFRHELAHVQQRHTWDKVFLLLILIPFWFNLFFWLIRKELAALHEFSADQKALSANDTAALSKMILNTAFPHQHFLFSNHFFQSTIKRRIAMFAKLQNPKVSYLSRVAALPVLLIVMTAFAVKLKPHSTNRAPLLNGSVTVVIDAGHGSKSGTKLEHIFEDDIALAVAKKVKTQNNNSNINIILTRDDNRFVPLEQRVQITAENKADLFISIHVEASPETQKNGMEVVISSKQPTHKSRSIALSSLLMQELNQIYKTSTAPVINQTSIWVLDKNVCPAVIVNCGYLTNKNDFAFIKKEQNHKRIADKILSAIAQYAALRNTEIITPVDTVPRMGEVEKAAILKDGKAIILFRNKDFIVTDWKDAVAKNYISAVEADEQWALIKSGTLPLIIADGKEMPDQTPATIEVLFEINKKESPVVSIDILKGEEAKNKYGDKGRNGVMVITTKKAEISVSKPSLQKLKLSRNFLARTADGWLSFKRTLIHLFPHPKAPNQAHTK